MILIFPAFSPIWNMYQTGYAIIVLAILFCFIGIAQYQSNQGFDWPLASLTLRPMTSKEVNQMKVEKGISVEKQMLQEIRENFDPYEKRLPGVKHLRKQKSKDESQRSNLLRRVYHSIMICNHWNETILYTIVYTV